MSVKRDGSQSGLNSGAEPSENSCEHLTPSDWIGDPPGLGQVEHARIGSVQHLPRESAH